MTVWSDWLPFPDPRNGDRLIAPLGPGCYELRRRDSGQLVLFGSSGHVGVRMTSLLPRPLGCGTRKNSEKRDYVLKNLRLIDYRTASCPTRYEALSLERTMRRNSASYIFST